MSLTRNARVNYAQTFGDGGRVNKIRLGIILVPDLMLLSTRLSIRYTKLRDCRGYFSVSLCVRARASICMERQSFDWDACVTSHRASAASPLTEEGGCICSALYGNDATKRDATSGVAKRCGLHANHRRAITHDGGLELTAVFLLSLARAENVEE